MNDEGLLISAILGGISFKELLKQRIRSEDFRTYKDEMAFLERSNGKISRTLFKRRFPDFRIKKTVPEDWNYIVEEYKKRLARNKLAGVLQGILEDFDTTDPLKMAEQLQLQTKALLNSSGTIGAVNVISDWREIYEGVETRARLRAEGKAVGIATNIPTIDRSMGGLIPGELVIVLGYQGEGKSWLQAYLTASALHQEKRVLFISLEMPKARLTYRIHTMISSHMEGEQVFSNTSLETGEGIDLERYKRFLKRLAKEKRMNLYVEDKHLRSINEVRPLVEEFKPDVVFWDYLGLNTASGGKNSQNWEVVGDEASFAKEIAMEYDIPFVVAAQANRSGASDRENTPGLTAIAKSYLIGAHADRIISLRSNRKEITLELIKNRYGPGVRVTCDWDVDLGIIREQTVKLPRSMKK